MEVLGYNESGSIGVTLNGVLMTVPDDMANRHRQMIYDWEFGPPDEIGQRERVNTIPPYEPPPPPAEPPPSPILCCLANLKIENGEISGIETAAGLQMALWVGPGVYWVFFAEPAPDTNYIADASASAPTACVSARETEYIEVTVTGADGVTFDPAEVSIKIYRVQ